MKVVPSLPPAPVGQQAPPTCAAARHEGALRVARGSLPLTTGTGCRGDNNKHKKKENARCWYEGYRAGRLGQPMRSPYTVGTIESWSWVGGWIEGNHRREKDARRA